MESQTVIPNLTMLRVNGWQVYVWRDGDSATLIDTATSTTSVRRRNCASRPALL
jgi:IS1 family transposase